MVAEDAIYKFGAIQKQGELERMLKIVEDRQPQVILEIGTAEGGTLYALCQTAPADALIISLDSSYHTYALNAQLTHMADFREAFKKPDQDLHFLHADSHDDTTLEYVKGILDGKAVDFMFLDGDHTYFGVKQDWEMYSPLVDGLVAFHDINTHTDKNAHCHVMEFWEELKTTHAVFAEIFSDPSADDGLGTWAGIGIIKT